MNQGYAGDCAKTALRETVAGSIVASLNLLVERAAKVASLVSERTADVTNPPVPTGTEKDLNKAERAYPPLFSEIRNSIAAVNGSLDCIEDTMQRCEL